MHADISRRGLKSAIRRPLIDGRHGVAVLAFVAMVAALARVDGLVAMMVGTAFLVVVVAVRWRGPQRFSRIVGAGVAAVVAGGLVVGLALPTLAQRQDPLIVNVAAQPSTQVSPSGVSVPLGQPPFEILGYVASDYEDSAAGVDRDVALVTTLAPTGVVLGRSPGTLEITDSSDSLVRAHAAGTRALAVVSNFDGSIFNGERVRVMLASSLARRKFVSAMTKLVAQQGWDGVVLDLENLPAAVHTTYPSFIREIDTALGSRTVDVAVPAFTDPTDPDLRAYDLKAIAAAADRVTWMAYDQHELSTAAGPVAALPWASKSIDLALTSIPATKLVLGVAAYGYAWSSPGHATEYSVPQAKELVARRGASVTWDGTAGEEHGKLADGRTIWYSDARSVAARAQLALDRGLGGIALWRVGSDEPGALADLPVAARRQAPIAPLMSRASDAAASRPIEQVHAHGVVALTFDDGPDPKWTPQILAILRRAHVPATFFVIGQEAQAHPGLVRDEVRDGDVVGNHTYSHKNLSEIGTLHAKVEILGGAAVIEGITGQKPYLFRSPYGAGDMSTKNVGGDQLANDAGEHSVPWNVDPQDWSKPGTIAIGQRVAQRIQERSVVLLHDGGGDRSQTIAALPGIIENLKAQKYLFTTVDGLDGSIASPYIRRSGLVSKGTGLLVIAGFRLWSASRRAFLLASR